MNLNRYIKSPANNRYFWLWLFCCALFIRFPFFFRDYIDKDESTFILMGQAWAEGHLPYTYLWDLKPPLTFGYFAGIISLVGKSFFWIRLGGVLLVCFTAYTVYLIAIKNNVRREWAALMSFLSLLFSSLFGSVQGVMSEHISMLFFMGAVYLLLLNKIKIGHYFLAGLLLGFSAMTKLNLAYAILLLGAYITFKEIKQRPSFYSLKKTLALAIGGALGVGITAMPYLFKASLQIWWASVFLASGSYAQINGSNSLVLLPLIIGILAYIIWRKNSTISLIGLALIGVLGSFIMAGKLNGHYLLQAYPLFFLLLAIGFKNKQLDLPRWNLVFLLLLPVESYLEYQNVFTNYQEKGHLYNGEGVDIPDYLAMQHPSVRNILFLEYHIGYWLLGQKPLSMAVTHPSNLFRERLFPYFNPRKTSQEELEHLLNFEKPGAIVIDKKHSLFKNYPAEKAFFESQLAAFYTRDTLIGKGVVYLRK